MTSGDRPRALPDAEEGALGSDAEEGARASDEGQENLEAKGVKLQPTVVNKEAFEIHPASIPESKADRYSPANR
jgi:hypothetical protein